MSYLIKIFSLIVLIQLVNCESEFKAEDIAAILQTIPEAGMYLFIKFIWLDILQSKDFILI